MERLKHLFRLSLLLFCGLAVSCSNDDGDGTFLQEDYPVTFGTVFNNLKSSTGNTWDGDEQVAVMINSEVKKYTTASSGALTVTSGTPFYWQSRSETKTVQAWYPYSASAPTSWSVQSGQSGTGYQQSDLLYAPVTDISFANRNSASLPFYHQTAKVVVNIVNGEAATSAADISGVKIGDNNNLALSGDYTPPSGSATQGTWSNLTEMGVVSPNDITSGTTYLKSYAALVIPQDMAGKKFIAVALSNGNTYYYTPTGTAAALEGGKQYTYNITVKKGYLEVEVKNSTAWTREGQESVTSKDVRISYSATDLKPGDYYYSDGRTSDGGLQRIYTDGTGAGAGSVPPTVGKTVIGIVFWVGDPTEPIHDNGTAFTDFGDPALRLEKSNCTHGLVVALQDASTNTLLWQSSSSDVGGWVSSNTSYETITTSTGATDALNKLRGYNNTQAIRVYNAQCVDANKVLSVQAIDTWAVSTPTPTSSSGWYLPSEKELTLLCGRDVNDLWLSNSGGTGMRNIVNTAMENVSGATTISQTFFYWSCSEDSNSKAWCLLFTNGATLYTGKTSAYNIRPILAF